MRNDNFAIQKGGSVQLQLDLDEDIEIGITPLISSDDEMRVSLIRYRNRRYASLSRIQRGGKNKKTGKEKILHLNSIWIPISSIDEIVRILIQASTRARNLGYGDYCGLFEEEEDKMVERYTPSVREDARLFLEESSKYVENSISLIIKTKVIADRTGFIGMRLLRALDYLEDSGYIKVISKEEISANDTLLERPFPRMDTYHVEQIEKWVYKRALYVSGLLEDDVEGIDYFEDDDPRIAIWNYSKKFAEFEVMNLINSHNFISFFKITAAGYDWLE